MKLKYSSVKGCGHKNFELIRKERKEIGFTADARLELHTKRERCMDCGREFVIATVYLMAEIQGVRLVHVIPSYFMGVEPACNPIEA